ncbi:neural cell adhesion molecule 2 precursor-like protein [Leptotrombidium deliense]|uniref:Neural cell adhesion molecule 2-like protein n=1 Tax=Leptotrombidium deliense TaxID=299467 RepID=A0A443SE34_9ACAR|nr:neural cell adhesion molecule 2 precursor-like protein [Leptotrombidium deliense]
MIDEKRNQIFCDVIDDKDDENTVQFKWLDASGNEIKNNRNFRVEYPRNRKSSALVFRRFNNDLSGNFTCQVNVSGTQLSARKGVKVVNIRELFNCEKKLKLVESKDIKREHKIFNISVVEDHYFVIIKNGIQLKNSDYTIINNTILLLGDANDSLVAKYEIKLSFEKGETSFIENTIVLVHEKPKIKEPTKTKFNVEENTFFGVACNATGKPKPITKWLKYDKPIALNASLVFENISRQDEGVFTCIAENEIGTDSKSIKIRTFRRPYIEKIFPSTVKEGENTSLVCEAEGYPALNMSIALMNRASFTKSTLTIENYFRDKFRATLFLYNATRHDNGQYKCTVFHYHGNASNMTTLEVQFKPEVYTKNSKIVTWGNKQVAIHCTVSSNPTSNVEWRKNTTVFHKDNIIANNESIHKVTHRLTLKPNVNRQNESENIYGIYTCTATNTLGIEIAIVEVIEGFVPSKAENIVWRFVGHQLTITMNSHRENNVGVSKVILIIAKENKSDKFPKSPIIEKKDSGYCINVTISNLSISIPFTLTITLMNEVGESDETIVEIKEEMLTLPGAVTKASHTPVIIICVLVIVVLLALVDINVSVTYSRGLSFYLWNRFRNRERECFVNEKDESDRSRMRIRNLSNGNNRRTSQLNNEETSNENTVEYSKIRCQPIPPTPHDKPEDEPQLKFTESIIESPW